VSVRLRQFRWSNPSDAGGLLAFLVFLALSLLIVGRPLLGDMQGVHAGMGEDSTIFMWDLTWWPYALGRGLNPFYTYFIWYPVGVNLTGTASIPLPAILMWPITAKFGPVAAFNILTLLAPALAAWGAFVLCRYVSKSWWPSLLGGYIFGFTNENLLHVFGAQLHMALAVFLVPLAILATARAIAGEIASATLTAALAAILAAEVLISTETCATMTMFGAMALVAGWSFSPEETARRTIKAALPILYAYVLAAVALSPFIYWLFARGWPPSEATAGEAVSLDLLQFLGLDNRPSNLPILAITAVYAWQTRHTPLAKVLLASLAIVSIFTLGPRLHVYGEALFLLPGKVLDFLPVMKQAFPARIFIYCVLLLAIVVTHWFSSNGFGPATNAVFATIVIAFTVPNLLSHGWSRPADIPSFFTTEMYRNYLKPGENVLVFPFGARGDSMLWQAESNMYFRMVGGHMGVFPAEYSGWPIFQAFYLATYIPDAASQLGAFLIHHQVDAAIVANGEPEAERWDQLLSQFSSTKNSDGGVTIYRIRPSALEPYRQTTALEMRQQAALTAADRLLGVAGGWLAAGHNLGQLTAFAAYQNGMLKESWCVGDRLGMFTGKPLAVTSPGSPWFCGVMLTVTPDGQRLVVGEFGTYADLEPTIARYRTSASHIYFPYPHDLLAPRAPASAVSDWAFMKLEFAPSMVAALSSQLPASQP